MAAKPEAKLHYNKNALLADYNQTFTMFMKVLMVGIGGALVYFLVFVVYLGGTGHTPSTTYVQAFGSRITTDYKGTKLPMFEDPSKAEQFINNQPKAK
jgi:putative flippase GtrA